MGYDIRDRDNIGEISVNHPNHIVVTADMSSSTWNTVGTHEVFTVTGNVHMRMWIICKSSLTSGGAATFSFGVESDPTYWFASLGYANILSGFFAKFDASSFYAPITVPTQGISTTAPSGILDVFHYDEDFGYQIATAALTNGTVEFHCIWQPLTVGATVVAGSGGSL